LPKPEPLYEDQQVPKVDTVGIPEDEAPVKIRPVSVPLLLQASLVAYSLPDKIVEVPEKPPTEPVVEKHETVYVLGLAQADAVVACTQPKVPTVAPLPEAVPMTVLLIGCGAHNKKVPVLFWV